MCPDTTLKFLMKLTSSCNSSDRFFLSLVRSGFVAVTGSISVSSDLSFFVRLAAPPGHVIMTSFVYLDIGAESRLPLTAPLCRSGGFLEIFTGQRAASSIWPEGGLLCAGSDTDPHLYSAEDLFLRIHLVSHGR